MKRLFLLTLLGCTLLFLTSSCKRCKKCHSELMGVKSPAYEMCGDQLEQAEKTPTMVCE